MAKGLEDILGDAKKKGNELWSAVKSTGKDKLKEAIAKLNKALPDIEEAGFELTRLDVDIALLPRLFTRFDQVRVITPEAKEAILAKTKNDKFLNFILIGLFKAVDIRNEVDIDKMDLKEIELEIGLTPSVKLIFRKDKRIKLIA